MNAKIKIDSVLFYGVILVLINLSLYSIPWLYVPEDATLNFTQLGSKYGLIVQEHDVVTEDGYILKLFNIPGDRDKTVLLMHGLLDSADTFIVRGRGSLVAALATAGYDVWVGNYRGTTHSRRHIQLNPETDGRFWNFSFHEVGAFDLPATIDFILLKNEVKQLSAIGHSQGNMIFYVLGSSRPEYNEKIKVMIALGPVCYLNTENYQFPLSAMLKAGSFLNQILLTFNKEEVLGVTCFLTYFRNSMCTQRLWGYRLCGQGIFFNVGGEDIPEYGPDFFFTTIGHYPMGTSRKNMEHLVQIAEKGEFQQFDYGAQNLALYNTSTPPAYNLKKVTMKTALLVGRNDKLTPLDNVALLRKQLPNVVKYKILDHPKFNHIDHVWGKNMHKYLFPYVLNILSQYS